MTTEGPSPSPHPWAKDLAGATLRFAPEEGQVRGLHDQVTRRLGISIVSGQRSEGSLLPTEDELCEEFAVSRTVIRTAVKVLASKGLVQPRQKVGTRVCERSSWNLLDADVLVWLFDGGVGPTFLRELVEVRYVIEPAAAEYAAVRADARHRERIASVIADMQVAVDTNDSRAFGEADHRFHDEVLAAAQNEMLERIGSTIRVALNATRGLTNRLIADGPRTAMPLHADVATAIHERDPVAARAAMEAVIERAAHDLELLLTAQRAKEPS